MEIRVKGNLTKQSVNLPDKMAAVWQTYVKLMETKTKVYRFIEGNQTRPEHS